MAEGKTPKPKRAARRTLRGVQVAESVAQDANRRRDALEALADAAVALPSIAEALREYLTSVGLIGVNVADLTVQDDKGKDVPVATLADVVTAIKSRTATAVSERTLALLS